MKIKLNESKCTGCGICEENCPVGAIVIQGIAHINHDDCLLCATCVAECPEQALSLEGLEEQTVHIPEPLDYSGRMEGYGRGGGHHKTGHREKGKGFLRSWFK